MTYNNMLVKLTFNKQYDELVQWSNHWVQTRTSGVQIFQNTIFFASFLTNHCLHTCAFIMSCFGLVCISRFYRVWLCFRATLC
jgi:hypothetical protein